MEKVMKNDAEIFVSIETEGMSFEQVHHAFERLTEIGRAILGNADAVAIKNEVFFVNDQKFMDTIGAIGRSFPAIGDASLVVAGYSTYRYGRKQRFELDAADYAGVPVVSINLSLIVPGYDEMMRAEEPCAITCGRCNGKVDPPSPPNK